jgi:hypothetical protein
MPFNESHNEIVFKITYETTKIIEIHIHNCVSLCVYLFAFIAARFSANSYYYCIVYKWDETKPQAVLFAKVNLVA